jgi:hypothetical protein
MCRLLQLERSLERNWDSNVAAEIEEEAGVVIALSDPSIAVAVEKADLARKQ